MSLLFQRLLSTVLAAVVGACSASPEPAPAEDRRLAAAMPENLIVAEIATVGWESLSNSPIVLVRELDTGRVVPIWVGTAEARAIAMALHGIQFPRPLTHDLMTNLIAELHAELDEVWIHGLEDGIYLGLLRLEVDGEDEARLVDTRPSDALALALRTGATIRIAREIVEQTPDFNFLAPEASDQVVRALGLTVVAASDELRRTFTLPERAGVVVTSAVGDAAIQGLRRGDLIVAINGEVPETPVDFLAAVEGAPLSQLVRITYWREGEEIEVEIAPDLPEPAEGESRQIA